MSQTLNVGILAHVDAGKTSLTERLLFDSGVITELGSVDKGSTQTDTGDVERRRGITIRSAVASFLAGDLQVNIVDTPGHPDFVAEVERAMSVLDGVVLVISAVEGVQAQTRVLVRSLRRMRLPVLVFVNKVDRVGARYDGVLSDIRRKLGLAVLPMVTVTEPGSRGAAVVPRSWADGAFRAEVAELLADNDDEVLARVVGDATPGEGELRSRLVTQTGAGLLHPVYFGSALSGAGAPELVTGVRTFLGPVGRPAPGGRARGTVFAVERAGRKEKVAYLRLFSGELHERQRVTFRRRGAGGVLEEYTGRIAGLEVVTPHSRASGGAPRAGPLTAGNIAKIRGLPQIRVDDRLGDDGPDRRAHFSPPILESTVRPRHPGQAGELHAALTQLADEDPLIRTRTTAGGRTSVLLYGAVQREVISERLTSEFGVEAIFEQARPVYFERPVGVGEALHEFNPRGGNEFHQTVGLRVEPAPVGAGNRFAREVEGGLLPRAYHRAIEDSAMATLRQGLHGWEVTDCSVTVTRVGYEPPKSTAADFRNLTPMVLMQALQVAGTKVHEPTYAVELEIPEDSLSRVIGLMSALGADVGPSTALDEAWHLPGEIPARLLHDLATGLPGLTHGEGTIWYEPGTDRPVRGPRPVRERFDGNPLDHDEYMRFLSNRGLAETGSAGPGGAGR